MNRKEGGFSPEEASKLIEISAEAMATAIALQLPQTFRRLVEAESDEDALEFYRRLMSLNSEYQSRIDDPLSNPVTSVPTADELVDL